jgi:hypothetical protein
MFAIMIGAIVISSARSVCRSTGQVCEHSKALPMHVEQNVCRHVVMTGSMKGERHIGQHKLSSIWLRYVRFRRSSESSEIDLDVMWRAIESWGAGGQTDAALLWTLAGFRVALHSISCNH